MTTVRRLSPADTDAYVALRREMLLDAPWAFGSSPGDDRDPASIRAALAKPDNAIFAAVEGNRLLASAGVLREPKLKRSHIAFIWGVYVIPPARGRGLARAVTSAAIDAARTWPDIDLIQLSVSENAPAARHLYQSLGFTPWGIEPDALRTDGESFAEIHMHLRLNVG